MKNITPQINFTSTENIQTPFKKQIKKRLYGHVRIKLLSVLLDRLTLEVTNNISRPVRMQVYLRAYGHSLKRSNEKSN